MPIIPKIGSRVGRGTINRLVQPVSPISKNKSKIKPISPVNSIVRNVVSQNKPAALTKVNQSVQKYHAPTPPKTPIVINRPKPHTFPPLTKSPSLNRRKTRIRKT